MAIDFDTGLEILGNEGGYDFTSDEADGVLTQLGGPTDEASSDWWSSILGSLGIGAGNAAGLLGGISGNQAGMGLYGALGLLSSLTQQPQVGTKQTTESRTGTTTTEVGSPEWYKSLTENLGTAISGDNKSWSDLQGYLSSGADSVADADLSKYMNPYTEAVLAPQITRMTEDFTRGENSRRAKAGMMGAFGGSRDILEGSLANERFDKAKSEATNTALSQAYTSAMDAFGKDRAAQQWGATATGGLYGLLKPNTTTGVTATAGDTNTTVATGPQPNTFGDMANWVRNLWGMGNPPVPSTTTPAVTTPPAVAP